MDVFHAVKANISTNQAAEFYGFKPDRSSLIRCPFHNDRTPSMKVDRRYYCFGCGATGDVIDFTAHLYGLDLKDAALKLAKDFNISYEYHGKSPPDQKTKKMQTASVCAEVGPEQKRNCYIKKLLDCRDYLNKQKERYKPEKMGSGWSSNFVKTLQELAVVEGLADTLLFESKGYLKCYIDDIGREVRKIEDRNIWRTGAKHHGDAGKDEADDTPERGGGYPQGTAAQPEWHSEEQRPELPYRISV